MKKLAVAILAALLWASGVSAQTVTHDGQSTLGQMQATLGGGLIRADTSMKAFTMSTTGGLATYDESPNREMYHLWENIIIADSTSGPDSTVAIIDTHAYRHLKLLLKIWPIAHGAAGYKNNIRLAVQVRTHINGLDDSLSTFAEYPNVISANGIAAVVDTSVTGHIATGSATAAWSGEFVVNIDVARSAGTANTYQYPSGIAIPLDSMFGRAFWAPGVTVRVRKINTDGWKWGGAIHLIGTAL